MCLEFFRKFVQNDENAPLIPHENQDVRPVQRLEKELQKKYQGLRLIFSNSNEKTYDERHLIVSIIKINGNVVKGNMKSNYEDFKNNEDGFSWENYMMGEDNTIRLIGDENIKRFAEKYDVNDLVPENKISCVIS